MAMFAKIAIICQMNVIFHTRDCRPTKMWMMYVDDAANVQIVSGSATQFTLFLLLVRV